MPTYGSERPIQRVPNGLPGPGGTGSASSAHGDGGGYHQGLRCKLAISKVPSGVGYSARPVATPNQRTYLASSKKRRRFEPRRITTASSRSADSTFGFVMSYASRIGTRLFVARAVLMDLPVARSLRRRPS